MDDAFSMALRPRDVVISSSTIKTRIIWSPSRRMRPFLQPRGHCEARFHLLDVLRTETSYEDEINPMGIDSSPAAPTWLEHAATAEVGLSCLPRHELWGK